MKEAHQRLGSKSGRIRVAAMSHFDALVGEYVTGDPPEVAWQDSYGLFRFTSRAEAEEAIHNSYYRLFRPDLDWDMATIEEIRHLPPLFQRPDGRVGSGRAPRRRVPPDGDSPPGRLLARRFFRRGSFRRTPALAICLAALRARGIDPIFCDSLLEEDIGSRIDSAQESETVDSL